MKTKLTLGKSISGDVLFGIQFGGRFVCHWTNKRYYMKKNTKLGKSVCNSVQGSLSSIPIYNSVFNSVSRLVNKSVLDSIWESIDNSTMWRIRL